MNYFIFTLLIATLGSNLANAYLKPKDFVELLASLAEITHRKCNIITGSGFDEDIANMRAGIFNDDDQNLKLDTGLAEDIYLHQIRQDGLRISVWDVLGTDGLVTPDVPGTS
ncbi:hypothetical protein JTB14_033112 [Gonioctena quinquepunctata]|nr:hypothetical protein JTB14_033112 [Gonioctena quinquepunctata]